MTIFNQKTKPYSAAEKAEIEQKTVAVKTWVDGRAPGEQDEEMSEEKHQIEDQKKTILVEEEEISELKDQMPEDELDAKEHNKATYPEEDALAGPLNDMSKSEIEEQEKQFWIEEKSTEEPISNSEKEINKQNREITFDKDYKIVTKTRAAVEVNHEEEAARQEAEYKAKSKQRRSKLARRLQTKEAKVALAFGILVLMGLGVLVTTIVLDLQGGPAQKVVRYEKFRKTTKPEMPRVKVSNTMITADTTAQQMNEVHRKNEDDENIKAEKKCAEVDAKLNVQREEESVKYTKIGTRGRDRKITKYKQTRQRRQRDESKYELIATGKVYPINENENTRDNKKASKILRLAPGTRIKTKLETGLNSRYSSGTVLARVIKPVVSENRVVIPVNSMLKGKLSSGDSRVFVDFFEVVVVNEGAKKLRGHAISGSLPGIPAKASANSRTRSSGRSRAGDIAKRTSLRALGDTATRLIPGGTIFSEIGTDVARESVTELGREDYSSPGQTELEVPSGTRFSVVITD